MRAPMFRRSLSRLSAPMTLASAWLVPSLAMACPVCFDATDANRAAYLGTTVFLSLLPLIVIGSLLMFLRVRSKRAPILRTEASGLRSINTSDDLNFDVRPRTGKAMDSKG